MRCFYPEASPGDQTADEALHGSLRENYLAAQVMLKDPCPHQCGGGLKKMIRVGCSPTPSLRVPCGEHSFDELVARPQGDLHAWMSFYLWKIIKYATSPSPQAARRRPIARWVRFFVPCRSTKVRHDTECQPAADPAPSSCWKTRRRCSRYCLCS